MTTLNLEKLREQAERQHDFSFIETEGPDTLRFDDNQRSAWFHSDGSTDGDARFVNLLKRLPAYQRFLNPRQPGVTVQHKLSLARQSRDAKLDGALLVCYYHGDQAVAKAYPKNKEEIEILYTALYDHHQCEDTFQVGDTIHLPDGKLFATVHGIQVELDAAYANRIR